MFPIFDPRGQVIGFGARSLDGSEPKYLNSPETPIFSKRRGLYGLHRAKESAAADRRLFLVEGYTDVIMARQHGIEGVVAALGTALTPDHLTVLRRYAETVVLVYDGDEAGAKASERSTDLLLGEECEIRVSRLPPGEDPCDTLVKRGAEAFRACLDASQELFEFLLDSATAGRNLDAVPDRARAADGVIARIGAVRNPVRRELLVKQTAEAFGVTEAAVRERLAALAAHVPERRRDAPAPEAPRARPGEEEKVGEKLLTVAFFAPRLLPAMRERIPLEAFPGTVARAIASKLYALAESGRPVVPAEAVALLDDAEQVRCASAVLAKDEGEVGAEGSAEALLQACLDWIARRAIDRQIQEAKTRKDFTAYAKLIAEKDRLLSRATT
jgi:DNA primase